jgi:K+-transporting ATPase ATPase C chain
MLLALTLVTGVAYPLAVTGIGRVFFARQAAGSLIVQNGQVKGSELIGQPFSGPGYFWGRPSATGPAYNAGASSGSNLGPIHPALADSVKARIAALRAADSTLSGPIPVDLVTASGSGLDPHISVAAARIQARRIARVRGISEAAVDALIDRYTRRSVIPFFGESVVPVLSINLALDAGEVDANALGD